MLSTIFSILNTTPLIVKSSKLVSVVSIGIYENPFILSFVTDADRIVTMDELDSELKFKIISSEIIDPPPDTAISPEPRIDTPLIVFILLPDTRESCLDTASPLYCEFVALSPVFIFDTEFNATIFECMSVEYVPDG